MPEVYPHMLMHGAIEADFPVCAVVAEKVKALLTKAKTARIVNRETGTRTFPSPLRGEWDAALPAWRPSRLLCLPAQHRGLHCPGRGSDKRRVCCQCKYCRRRRVSLPGDRDGQGRRGRFR